MFDKQNLSYEDLYVRLLERGESLHAGNKKRIRIGLIGLVVFTVLMVFIRWLTESDRVVFLLIWILGMFAISIYLIGIEYLDSTIQETLTEVTEREADLGELILDSEEVRERIHDRIGERIEERRARRKAEREAEEAEAEARRAAKEAEAAARRAAKEAEAEARKAAAEKAAGGAGSALAAAATAVATDTSAGAEAGPQPEEIVILTEEDILEEAERRG